MTQKVKEIDQLPNTVMNSYNENNTCINKNCKKTGEVIYHQYQNIFSCQWCGKWWNNE